MQSKGSGMSPKRLKNAEAYLKRLVDDGKVAGSGGMIIRRDEEAFCYSAGFQDLENKIPMKNDSIYRIFSMTKTFTVVAAMTLYEKGLFRLRQPLADFIPAFADVQVAQSDERGIVTLVPAKQPITIEHLFTMTSGFPYPGDTSFSSRQMMELNALAIKADAEGKPWPTLKRVEETAKIPLCFHPGERWLYGFSHDILGALIEVLSGKTLGAYLKETIFDPLGLKDTAFYIPPEKQNRSAKAYAPGPSGLVPALIERDPAGSVPPAFESGGGGLCSTMADCARYAQMLLHGGKLDDERIISRKTLDLMRVNHVDVPKMEPSFFDHMIGYGYGLGVRTLMDPAYAGLNGSAGEWAWDGALGTYYLVDQAEDLVALFFIQSQAHGNSTMQRGFVQTVYGAIDD